MLLLVKGDGQRLIFHAEVEWRSFKAFIKAALATIAFIAAMPIIPVIIEVIEAMGGR